MFIGMDITKWKKKGMFLRWQKQQRKKNKQQNQIIIPPQKSLQFNTPEF